LILGLIAERGGEKVAVTTKKIHNSAVTAAKIAKGAVPGLTSNPAWGSVRARALGAAMAAGRFASAPELISTAMAVAGVILGVGTVAVIFAA
jgi:hypothetical protein